MTTRATALELPYVRGGVATYLPGELFGPRRLFDFEFVWILDGDAVYQHDGVDAPAPAETVILGRPGFSERYRWDPARPTRHAYFHFALPAVPGDWPPPDSWPITRPPSGGDAVRPLFRRVMQRWCARWDHRDVRPPASITRLVEAMLDEFLLPSADAERRDARRAPEPVRRAVRWVQTRLTEQPDAPMTLADLARAAAISPSQLVRQFRQSLGLTPMRALQLMRLEQAMTLLHRSNLSVGEVATRCGFASPFHFSRVFTRAYGLAPSEARRRFENGGPRPPSPLPIDAPPLSEW